ncbi:hypothetical protein RMQ49_004465 [Vibrio parahaemolyticus]|nr:hypothetical protein [Vibrio parahaemolyticus]
MDVESTAIDFPSWISAICAIAAIIISSLTAFKSKKYYSEYALVSSDGTVLSQRGFGRYGLQVELASMEIDNSCTDQVVPEYVLKFSTVPDYFEISTREGAVIKLKQVSPHSYTLRFVGAGYGDPIVRCNFKIQAY